MPRRARVTVSWFVPVLAIVLAAQSCRQPEPPAQKPSGERTVVSLVPNATETLFAMGLGNRVVGRSRYCSHPPESLELPVLGDALNVNFEGLLKLDPDLVVFNTSDAQFYDRLTSAGIRCLAPRVETVDDVYRLIDLLGREMGAETAAGVLAEHLRGDLAALAARGTAQPRVAVLVTFPSTLGGGGDVRVVGRGTFVHQLLESGGGRNVVPTDGYPSVSVETVVRWAPEVIVISAPGDIGPVRTDEQYRGAWSRWHAIPAVKNGRIVVLREPCLTIPGPRMARAARLLLKALHPEQEVELEAPLQ